MPARNQQHKKNNNSIKKSSQPHNHDDDYLRHKASIIVVISLVISWLIVFSSSAVTNTNINDFIAYAQLENNNNHINFVFPDNGPNTDRPPAFLDAFWTNNLSANSSVHSNADKKEVGPCDGTSTLAIVLVIGEDQILQESPATQTFRLVSSQSQGR